MRYRNQFLTIKYLLPLVFLVFLQGCQTRTDATYEDWRLRANLAKLDKITSGRCPDNVRGQLKISSADVYGYFNVPEYATEVGTVQINAQKVKRIYQGYLSNQHIDTSKLFIQMGEDFGVGAFQLTNFLAYCEYKFVVYKDNGKGALDFLKFGKGATMDVNNLSVETFEDVNDFVKQDQKEFMRVLGAVNSYSMTDSERINLRNK